MSKSLRLSEKWFRRGLWLVALVFAFFLIGLGSAVVGDLPQVQQRLQLDDFLAHPQQAQALRAQIDQAQQRQSNAEAAREQAALHWREARSNTQAAQDSFANWIATRSATQRSEQDPQVLARNQALDLLRASERSAQQALQDQDRVLLDTRQQAQRLAQQLADMERAAQALLQQAERRQALQVFGFRLALTLPLLALAGWLLARKRHSIWWPFVWGFAGFALFVFFVELVPYLPSYGGYVRYAVGIVLTVLVGRWAIVALQRYLQRQRQAEALPASQRRQHMDYDAAWAQWSKGVCPGCERPVDLKDGQTDFCPHCGMGLFVPCTACAARKSSFAKYCHRCGAGDGGTPVLATPQDPGAAPALGIGSAEK